MPESDVKPDASSEASVSEDAKTQTVAAITEVVAEPKAGDKTDPNLLLEALHKERDKRRELEKLLEASSSSEEVFSDEGKLIKKHVDSLEEEVKALREEREFEKVHSQFPALKEVAAEFDEFRKDYPRYKLENVAKLFLIEKGLLDTPRKGLEKPTGGPRTPVSVGMTHAEVENLRLNNWNKYREMLMKDQIVYSD